MSRNRVSRAGLFASRRQILSAGLGAALVPVLGQLAGRRSQPRAAEPVPHRFVQLFLNGGWDSALGIDPVLGDKTRSGVYDAQTAAQGIGTVPGKDRLIVGGGLMPALTAFAAVPTAFVNGLFVEVTAHELATQYLLTGVNSLARGDRNPAFVASMAAASGRFPSHVVMGQIPLGETKTKSPPLQSGQGVGGVRQMLNKPGTNWLSAGSQDTAFELGRTLDELRWGTDIGKRSAMLSAWQAADRRVPELYAAGYGPALEVNQELLARYGAQSEGSIAGQLAGCFLVLKSKLSRLVTATTGDFDTHTDHLPRQMTQLRELGKGLGVFISDLRATPDPDLPSVSLMDTTTILITSEFTRTPDFNKSGGSDHWPSASAIVMGKGVKDNVVIGATDGNARALGWDGRKGVPFNDVSRIAPEHLVAALLRNFGHTALAAQISDRPLTGLFT
jgi:hypothetical protein